MFHMNKVLFLKGNQNSDVKEAVRTRRTPTPTPKSYGTWEGEPSAPEGTKNSQGVPRFQVEHESEGSIWREK